MAEEQIVTRIVATSDFSNLIADLGKVSSALTNLQTKLNATNKNLAAQAAVMNRSFAETLRSTGQYSSHFVNLTSDVDKFGSQLDKGQIKLKQFFQTYQGHLKTNGGLIRQLAQQQVQLQNAILQPLGKNAEGLMQYNVHIPTGLDKVKNRTALARQELQIMNRVIQEGANSLINWGKNTQWAGRQLTVGLTVPLAAFGAASAKAFREADQELTRLTKVYGGLAATSAKDLAKVRQDVTATASELSKAYGSSFKETIALGADIAATGKQGNELLGSIRETTRLAVLGEVDRADAMKATLAIQSAFKSNTDELAKSINFLNAVENQTSTTLNDLVEAIPKAGPIVKGLGGDVQDLALYLTAMREGGISASEGANALKSGLASLINPTKVAKEMFAGFGISLTDIVQKNAGDTTATILSLQSALDTLNPLQKQQALEQLFGKFQFARMNALFENLGKQGSQTLQVMDLMKASSEELANIAGRELSMVTESASGKYRRALEGLKADLAGVGEQFLTINTHLINLVDGILKFINKLPGPIKTILTFFAGLTAVAGPLIMLTGVLANFFGYVIKGASHFRAMFKGGEGWRLLTPEILAANKAGSLVEATFYSDAKAAEILKTSVDRLSASYQKLAADASSAIISTNPGVSTVGGTSIIAGQRVVNPSNPLAGKQGTRAAGHHIPRSQMDEKTRLSQTIHSFTPLPIPLNQKIGAVPQIFTEGDLPKIPGLTTSGGASTGIVAGEAAKWHSLMGTLSMMTKREVADLKREIARTGTFSTEINSTFGQLLPAMTKLTSNAATESALIVQQLQAGKITVDAARTKIIAINAQLETMMAQTTTQVATSLGRTANLTQVPLINQPIVGPTGKANIKEIFRPNRPSSKIIDRIARALGVRTSGGGYSTETTIPKRMNAGGSVVPGPNVNADIVPAMLTPGEFVVNAKSTRENLPLLTAINNGMGSTGPGYNIGGYIPSTMSNAILGAFGIKSRSQGAAKILGNWGMLLPKGINSGLAGGRSVRGGELIRYTKDPSRQTSVGEFLAHQGVPSKEIKRIQSNIAKKITDLIDPRDSYNDAYLGQVAFSVIDKEIKSLESKMPGISLAYQKDRMSPGRRDTLRTPRPGESQEQANQRGGGSPTGLSVPGGRRSGYRTGRGKEAFAHFTDKSFEQNLGLIGQSMGYMVGSHNTAVGGIDPQTYSMPSHGRNSFLGMPLRRLGKSWSNPRYIGGKVGDRTYARANRGGIIGMNRGGVVPGLNTSGLNQPPLIQQMGLQSPTQMQPNEQMPKQRGMLAGNLIGMAGSYGGYSLGSKFGGQLGGFAGMMLLPAVLDKVISKMNLLGKTSTGTASILGRLGPILANPYLIAGTAVVGVTALLTTFKKKSEEVGNLNRIAFGGAVKPLTDFDSKLKEVTKKIEDTRAAAALLHSQMNTAGLPGLVLSIKQFADLRENVKTTYPEIVKLFKATESDKLASVAANIKAQFVAAGDAASVANAKIAALMAETGKTPMIQGILGDKGVSSIVDTKTAISSMLETLSTLSNKNDFATGLGQVFTSMEAAIANSTDKSAALKQQFDLIKDSSSKNLKINEDQLKAIAKQNPQLAAILGNSKNIGEGFAKWRIALGGVTKDLSGLNQNQLQEFAQHVEKVNEYFNKIADVSSKEAQNNSLLGKYAKQIDDYNKQQSKGQQAVIKNIESQISLKEKQIAQIKKEADERKKALRDQQQIEDVKLQIQQEQLNYQGALARGDMSSAATAQINIQRLVGQQQLKSAENAIDDAAQKKIDALQAQIDVLNKKAGVASSATSNKGKSALEEPYAKLTDLLRRVQISGSATAAQVSEFNDLISMYGGSSNKDIKALMGSVYSGKAPETITREDGQRTVVPLEKTSQYAGLQNALNSTAGSASIGLKIDKSNEYLKIIANAKDVGSGSGTLSSPKIAGNVDSKYLKNGQLTDSGMKSIIKENKLTRGQYFSYDGQIYYVQTGYDAKINSPLGIAKKVATGGYISGSGTATSDSIPAMLSNGEYVIRAAAVQSVGTSFLDGINRMSAGGIATKYSVPRMNMGGRIDMSNGGRASTSNALYNINVTLNGTDLTADDVARTIEQRMRRMQSKQGVGRVY
jgi:TP901 family phage tail tape measure protein